MIDALIDYAGFDGLNGFRKKWVVMLPNGDNETFNNKHDAEVFASLCRRKIRYLGLCLDVIINPPHLICFET